MALLLNEITPVLARLLMTQHRMLTLNEEHFYRALVVHLSQRPIATAS